LPAAAAIAADKTPGSTEPLTRIRAPDANSISITPPLFIQRPHLSKRSIKSKVILSGGAVERKLRSPS
jgi:hypothetical protein